MGTPGRRRRVTKSVAAVGVMILAVGWIGGTSAIRPAGGDGALVAWLDDDLPGIMASQGVPGMSILILRDGAPVWEGAYGMADVETGRPLTTESGVMAHSISKSVTAWGVMRLVEEGRIALDDPVARHLHGWDFPASDFPAAEVTVGRLLSNSAGVPLGSLGVEYGPGEHIPPASETLTGDEVRLRRQPGSAFGYSNSGFGILELLVEAVTDRDFAESMEDEVLGPLGMSRSTFAWRDDLASSVATGYDLDGHPVPPYRYPYQASGGLFTTLGDLGRFVAAELSASPSTDPPGYRSGEAGPVLSEESIAALHRPRVPVDGMFGVVADAYALGHFVETLPTGQRAVWHGGQGHGWMTHFHAVPSTGDGIVIVTNSQRAWPLMARILGEWSQDRGFGPVAFSRITDVVRALWISVAGLFLASAFVAWRAVRRARGFPLIGRVVAGGSGLTLLVGLGWAVVQDYLFITSIFPAGAPWLGAGVLALAMALLLAAGLPGESEGDSPARGAPASASPSGVDP